MTVSQEIGQARRHSVWGKISRLYMLRIRKCWSQYLGDVPSPKPILWQPYLTLVHEFSCLGQECYQVFDTDVTCKVACISWLVTTKGHSSLWKRHQSSVNQHRWCSVCTSFVIETPLGCQQGFSWVPASSYITLVVYYFKPLRLSRWNSAGS